jgi:solute carrier family 25 phosphate transporter 23/24/25/41
MLTIVHVEFHSFVMHTESELYSLFKTIDKDHNGKLDKKELAQAFKNAGVAVPSWKLNQFFLEVDGNRDV